MSRQDYLMGEDFDLIINDDDFAVGISDQNHKAVNIISNKGQIRNYVRIGVGIDTELNGILNQQVKRRILESFKRDKYNIKGIEFNDNQIYIPGETISKISTGSKSPQINAYPYYYDDDIFTTAPITSAEVKTLKGKGSNPQNGSTFTINISVGTTRVVFAYPANLQDVTTVKYIELGSGEVKDTFNLTNVMVEGDNGEPAVNYKVYTFLPVVPYGDNVTYIVTI